MALDAIAPFHTTRLQQALAGEVQQVPPAPTPVRQLIGNNLLTTVGVGPLAGQTLNYDLNLVNFDYRTWHEYEWQNWVAVDALLNAAFRGVENLSVWQPDTDYAVGDVVVSTETGLAYECLVAHHSDSDSILDDIALGYWSETVVGASYTKEESDARYVNVDGDAMTGPLAVSAMLTVGASPAAGMNMTYVAATSANINVAPALPLLVQFAGTTRFRFETNGALTNTTSVPTRASGDGRWLQLTGGTMTGPMVVQTPTAAGNPTTKQYVDDEITALETAAATAYMPKSGGTFTGPVLFNGTATFTDTSFPTPDDDNDAATKKYVDDAVSGGGVSPYVKKTGDVMTGILTLEMVDPYFRMKDTDGTADARAWLFGVAGTGGHLTFRSAPDSYTGTVARYVMQRDGALGANESIVTRANGDARYQQLSANTWTIEGTSPRLTWYDTDGSTDRNRISLYLGSNAFVFQTRDNANTLKGDIWRGTMSATGASEQQWRINNAVMMLLDGGGLDVTGTLNNSGPINATSGNITARAGSIIAVGGHLYARNDTTPQVGLRNAAGQTGALLYTDLATLGYWRQYESAASTNYTTFAFRYGGGGAGSNDVMRRADADVRYLIGPAVVNSGTYIMGGIELRSNAPYMNYTESDETTARRNWAAGLSGGNFTINPRASDGTTISGGGAFTLYRDDNGITDARIGFGSGGSASALPTADSIVTRAAGDARYALESAGAYAMYTSSSNASLTNFPIGTILMAFCDGRAYARNASIAMCISSQNTMQYVDSASGNSGSALSGTWRAKGNVNTGGPTYYYIVQRVA